MRHFVIAVAVLGLLFAPAAAKADIHYGDDFSGTSMSGIWYSPANTWGGASFYQNGGPAGVLNFRADGSGQANGQYSSNFHFDLNHDFYVSAQFNYSQTSPQQGGVGLGFYSYDGTNKNSTYIGSINAVYGTDNTPQHPLDKYFYAEEQQYNPVTQNYDTRPGTSQGVVRTVDNDWLGMYYNSATDTLKVGAFSAAPTGDPLHDDPLKLFGTEFSGADSLKTLVTSNQVGLNLTGWAESGQILTDGQATLDNFNAMSTAPEPVSTVLFLLGGATLAVRRLRKK